MNAALDHYADEPRVMHINGYTPKTIGRSALPVQFFSRFMHCWGWATWNSSWTKLKTDPKTLLDDISKRNDRSDFSLNDSIDMEGQLMSNIDGHMRTWAVKWSASIFLEEGLCLSPSVSMVRNIGLDGSGIHYNAKPDEPDQSDIKILGEFHALKPIPIRTSRFGPFYFEMHYSIGNKPSFISIVKFCVQRISRTLRS